MAISNYAGGKGFWTLSDREMTGLDADGLRDFPIAIAVSWFECDIVPTTLSRFLVGYHFRKILMNYFHKANVHFLGSHQHPIDQILHPITHLFAIAAVAVLVYDWRLTLLCLVLIQAFAPGGHAFFEKNEPAFSKVAQHYNPRLTVMVI